MESPRVFRAALYARLSKEDGEKEESNSIRNQLDLLQNAMTCYADITVQGEWIDDGYSGTSFERPAFADMMEAVRSGKVDCIAVKDLSRFGRNYVEAGRYIQRIFPFLGVRFLAINDGIDTWKAQNNWDNLLIPFKNLMNESYSMDLSIKVRSHLERKRLEGVFVGAFAPYGYAKSAKQKGKLEPEPFVAQVVQSIFEWTLEGDSRAAIAQRLNILGVESPAMHKKPLGFYSDFGTGDTPQWSTLAVGRVLENPVYLGTLEQGKAATVSYQVQKRVLQPKEKWVCTQNAHTAIVSAQDFAQVAELAQRQDRMTQGERPLLGGLCICADCASPMTAKTVPAGGKKYTYLLCSASKKGQCSRHSIRRGQLEESITIVLERLLRNTKEAQTAVQEAFLPEQCCRLQERTSQSSALLHRVQTDKKGGLLPQEEADRLCLQYAKQISTLQTCLAVCRMRLAEPPAKSLHRQLAEWVEKIFVYEGARIELLCKIR